MNRLDLVGMMMTFPGNTAAGGSSLYDTIEVDAWPFIDCNLDYSITTSAALSSEGGMVIPSAFAAFRLMNSSTFVTSWTGRSAGFSPLRIRPV